MIDSDYVSWAQGFSFSNFYMFYQQNGMYMEVFVYVFQLSFMIQNVEQYDLDFFCMTLILSSTQKESFNNTVLWAFIVNLSCMWPETTIYSFDSLWCECKYMLAVTTCFPNEKMSP